LDSYFFIFTVLSIFHLISVILYLSKVWRFTFAECNMSAIGVVLCSYYFTKYLFIPFKHLHASMLT
jgi:hypothetical protein